MKSFIVLAVLVAVAIAAPVEQLYERNAEIQKSTFDNLNVDKHDSYEVETINGTSYYSYSYSGPDGRIYRFISDKEGFRPIGKHISA